VYLPNEFRVNSVPTCSIVALVCILLYYFLKIMYKDIRYKYNKELAEFQFSVNLFSPAHPEWQFIHIDPYSMDTCSFCLTNNISYIMCRHVYDVLQISCA
jgi:hypothetical protein